MSRASDYKSQKRSRRVNWRGRRNERQGDKEEMSIDLAFSRYIHRDQLRRNVSASVGMALKDQK